MLKIKNKISFSWKEVFALCGGILFFPPEGVLYLGLGKLLTIYDYLTYLTVALFFLYVIINLFRRVPVGNGFDWKLHIKESAFLSAPFLQIFLSFLMLCVMLIPTVIYDGAIKMLFDRMCIVFGAYIIVRYSFDPVDRKKLVNRMFRLFFIISIINFVFVLLFYSRGSLRPTGSGDYWLFGQKNAIRNIVLPAVGFAAVRDEMNHEKFFSPITIATMIITLLTLILVKSGTSIVVALLLILFIILDKLMKKNLLNFKMFVISYAVISVLLVELRNIGIFRFFIEEVMGKDMSLSGRTDIWDSAMAGIEKRPILGRGIQTFSESELHTGYFFVSHAHNALLDILFKGGIVSAVLLILIVMVSCNKIWNKMAIGKNLILGYWTALIGAFLIAGIVGELWNFGFFVTIFCTDLLYRKQSRLPFGDDFL